MNDKVSFLWQVFTSVNGWIAVADAKALGLLAADGVIAGIVLNDLDDIVSELSSHSWGAVSEALDPRYSQAHSARSIADLFSSNEEPSQGI